MKLQVVYLQFTIYLFYEFDSKVFMRKIKCKDIKTGSVSPCNHFHMQTVLMTSRIVLQSVLKISVQKYSNAQIGLCCDVVHRGIMRPPLFLYIYIYISPDAVLCMPIFAYACNVYITLTVTNSSMCVYVLEIEYSHTLAHSPPLRFINLYSIRHRKFYSIFYVKLFSRHFTTYLDFAAIFADSVSFLCNHQIESQDFALSRFKAKIRNDSVIFENECMNQNYILISLFVSSFIFCFF